MFSVVPGTTLLSNYHCPDIQSGPYLDTASICIILDADHNIFKLQLYNEYGLKVHTLSFNLSVFSSKLEERLRNYSSSICNFFSRDHK